MGCKYKNSRSCEVLTDGPILCFTGTKIWDPWENWKYLFGVESCLVAIKGTEKLTNNARKF